ncbi:MAG: UDP-N-acetylmuramoyl-L-alanine--D-glutamate ligase [Symbiobacteriia bacterium]
MDTKEGSVHSGQALLPALVSHRPNQPESGDSLASRLAGRRVAVVGLGISNLALTRFLLRRGATVTAMDAKPKDQLGERYAQFAALPAEVGVAAERLSFRLGPDYLEGLAQFAIAFLTPGLPKTLPTVRAASEAGTILSSEIHLVFELSQAPIIGITGSAGKTTTTSLVGQIMQAAGRQTYVGGNIGRPLIEVVESIPPAAQIVLELSSFQLQLLGRSPQVGLLLNVSPNHLDIHESMAEYTEAKKNIFRFQGPADAAVLNWDRPETRAMGAECPGRVYWFSRRSEVERGAFLRGDDIVMRDEAGERVIASAGQIRLPGLHNIENTLAAVAATGLAGARPAAVARTIEGFRGVAHRLELIRELAGVRYINDSIATAPDRTIAALRTLGPEAGGEPNLVLIAGGYDKHLNYDTVAGEMLGRVRVLLLLGQTADKIEQALAGAARTRGAATSQGIPSVVRGRNLDELAARARELARPGEAVVLSPASASYDMYKNFEERGEHFRRLVLALQ